MVPCAGVDDDSFLSVGVAIGSSLDNEFDRDLDRDLDAASLENALEC